MRAGKRLKLAALGAAVAVAVVAIPAGFVSAGAGNTIPDGGVLRLHFEPGDNDYFGYSAPDADGVGGYAPVSETQIIGTEGQCKVALSGEPLVVLTGAGKGQNYPGVFDDGLGVGGKGTDGNGQPCGRIDYGQTLSLKLGTGLAGLKIDYAELDLELKYGTGVTATLLLGNVEVRTETITACSGSDCGPDSGDGDNYRVRVPASGTVLFDRIDLTPTDVGGAVSLEGGDDGTEFDPGSLGEALGTLDSLFHLTTADGYVTCATNVSEPGSGIFSEVDAQCTDTAVKVPYSLSYNTNEARLGMDLTGTTGLMFTWTITWADMKVGGVVIPEDATSIAAAGHWTTINYTGNPLDEHPVKWCETNASGDPALPSGEQWCLRNQVVDWVPTPVGESGSWVRITETLYGNGDPIGKRY